MIKGRIRFWVSLRFRHDCHCKLPHKDADTREIGIT